MSDTTSNLPTVYRYSVVFNTVPADLTVTPSATLDIHVHERGNPDSEFKFNTEIAKHVIKMGHNNATILLDHNTIEFKDSDSSKCELLFQIFNIVKVCKNYVVIYEALLQLVQTTKDAAKRVAENLSKSSDEISKTSELKQLIEPVMLEARVVEKSLQLLHEKARDIVSQITSQLANLQIVDVNSRPNTEALTNKYVNSQTKSVLDTVLAEAQNYPICQQLQNYQVTFTHLHDEVQNIEKKSYELVTQISELCVRATTFVGVTTVGTMHEKPMLTTNSQKFKTIKIGLLYNLKNESYPPKNQDLRKDVPISSGHVFTIHNLFSRDECNDLIQQTEKFGYENLVKEFDPTFRNNERVMVKSQELSDIMWKRISPYFRRDDIFRLIPIGFGNEGTWRPYRVNECIKFSKYLSGNYFLPHIDGPWVPNFDEVIMILMQMMT